MCYSIFPDDTGKSTHIGGKHTHKYIYSIYIYTHTLATITTFSSPFMNITIGDCSFVLVYFYHLVKQLLTPIFLVLRPLPYFVVFFSTDSSICLSVCFRILKISIVYCVICLSIMGLISFTVPG